MMKESDHCAETAMQQVEPCCHQHPAEDIAADLNRSRTNALATGRLERFGPTHRLTRGSKGANHGPNNAMHARSRPNKPKAKTRVTRFSFST